jgi:hypothetical protein
MRRTTLIVAISVLAIGFSSLATKAKIRPVLTQQEQGKDSTTKADPSSKSKKELEDQACGTVEINFSARTDKDQHPTPDPPTDKAMVYIIRPTMIGMAIQTKLAVDGHWIGANRGDNYFYFTLDPGEHGFCSEAENRSLLTAKLDAGKTYYFQQKMEPGFMKARSKFVMLSDDEGKKGLAKCHLSISEEKK